MNNAKMLLLFVGFAALVEAGYADRDSPVAEFSVSGNENVDLCRTVSAGPNHPKQFCKFWKSQRNKL